MRSATMVRKLGCRGQEESDFSDPIDQTVLPNGLNLILKLNRASGFFGLMAVMRKVFFCLLIVFTIGGGGPTSAEGPVGDADPAKALATQPGDRILGKPDAPITIIE